MGILTVVTRHAAWRALVVVLSLLGSVAVQAQNINVTAANSINGKVLSLNSTSTGLTGATTVENTDYKSFFSIQSLAFVVNQQTNSLDLVVADTIGGKIAVYPGDFATSTTPPAPTTATVIWKASQGGPVVPNGLSVDTSGNLWVVNQLPFHPQLWVFPAAPASGSCAKPLPNYAALCQPVLVDGSLPATDLLVETVSVPASAAGGTVNAGDLLVLTLSNPSTVLDYSFQNGGFVYSSRTTIITLPKGSTPAGMAFWPFGDGGENANSLLITNSLNDTILRYGCCAAPAPMTNFASAGGFGKLMFKIKTGYLNGAPYAFVAQTTLSGGDLLQYGEGASPQGPATLVSPPSPITQNVAEPVGLAVSNSAFAAPGACSNAGTNGCNPTGLLNHFVVPATDYTSPSLVENVCVVQKDPRVTLTDGVFSCSGATLLVNKVCPGFDTTPAHNMVIPGYLCGNSGDSPAGPQGFTLIQTLTNDANYFNTLVDNETSSSVANEPACRPAEGNDPTLGTVLWGPLGGQGNYVSDGVTNQIQELTSGCGTGKASSNGGSLWGLGFRLYLPGVTPEGEGQPSPGGPLFTLGDNKFQDLESTVAILGAGNQNITNPTIAGELAAQTEGGPTGCVFMSQSFFDFAQLEGTNPTQQTQDYTIAADLLSNADTTATPITCDSIVNANLGVFIQTPSSTPPVFNPSGQLRSYFANRYFLINSRVLDNQPNPGTIAAWPPSPAPPTPPSGFSTLPPSQDNQTSCVPAGYYPPPGGCPALTVPTSVVAGTQLTASFTLYGSNNAPAGCTLTSTDGTFTNTPAVANPQSYPYSGTDMGTVPLATSPGPYTYTLTCPYPDTAGAQSVTVSATVNVLAPPTISAPSSITSGSSVTVSWMLNGSSGCTLMSSDGMYPSGTAVSSSPSSATYTPTTAAPAITYTLACTAPSATSTMATTSVTAASTGNNTLNLSPNPAYVGQTVTITWPSSYTNAGGCQLNDNGAGGPPTFVSGPNGTYATYVPASADGPIGAVGQVTFTFTCIGEPALQATLTVYPALPP